MTILQVLGTFERYGGWGCLFSEAYAWFNDYARWRLNIRCRTCGRLHHP